jgi:hypothetical protein
LEIGQGQGPLVSGLIEEEGNFLKPDCIPDLSGIERVVKAKKIMEYRNPKHEIRNKH